MSCPSSSLAKMCGSGPDHVFCPSWERMLMSAAAAPPMKRKAGLGGGRRRARRGLRSVSLSPSALCPAVGTSIAGGDTGFPRDDGRARMTTLSSSFLIPRFLSGRRSAIMHELSEPSPPEVSHLWIYQRTQPGDSRVIVAESLAGPDLPCCSRFLTVSVRTDTPSSMPSAAAVTAPQFRLWGRR